MPGLIAEDLLLLLLDDESGRLTHASYLDAGLGGALLVELALAEHVAVRPRKSRWSRPKVVRAGHGEPEDPALGDALSLVEEKPRTAKDLVPRLGKALREPLLEQLAADGVVDRQDEKVLGLFLRSRWPSADSAREEAVRHVLGDVLLRGAEPDPRTAGLVAVLSAMGVAHRVLDREGTSAREVRARAKEVGEGAWAAQAVKDAIAAAQAAMAAVIAGSAIASSG